MKIAYFDCFSGISGDMVLGALLDLGVPEKVLLEALERLPVKGYSFHVTQEKRGAIAGTRVRIEIDHQPSRTFSDIESLILKSDLDDPVKEMSLDIFRRLAEAEAEVHQMPMDQVHFHEVGALDSILDVVGAAIGLHVLSIDKVYASRIPLGGGFVHTHHGVLPVPCPATVLLLKGASVYDSGIKRELVTPTGAAILAALAQSYGPMPDMTLQATGYGVGSHPASDPPNLLRILCGTAPVSYLQRQLLMVETHIDDMNPEFYGYVLDQLFALGVLDVALVPIQMKKNRPGTLLRVLLEPALEPRVLELLFRETTTLGVRVQEVKRVELVREIKEIGTHYGLCRVKSVILPGGERQILPEYEECKRIAEVHGLPLRKVYEEIFHASRSARDG